jgi:hypothetical protein
VPPSPLTVQQIYRDFAPINNNCSCVSDRVLTWYRMLESGCKNNLQPSRSRDEIDDIGAVTTDTLVTHNPKTPLRDL